MLNLVSNIFQENRILFLALIALIKMSVSRETVNIKLPYTPSTVNIIRLYGVFLRVAIIHSCIHRV